MKLLLLDVISRSELPETPSNWIDPLAAALHSTDPAVLQQSVRTVGTLKSSAFDDRLAELADDASQPIELRVAALRAEIARRPQLTNAAFNLLARQLGEDVLALQQLAAADVLGLSRLNNKQLLKTATLVRNAGPLQLPVLIGAFGYSTDKQVGLALATALRESDGAQALTAAQLTETFARYPSEAQQAIQPLVNELNAESAGQQEKLESLLATIAGGDPKAGREIFFGKKAACFACHRVVDQGGQVGPDLSKIGQVRTARDLVESVVFPSATFARGFQPYTVATINGKIHSGVISRETRTAIFLMTLQRTEQRVLRSEIEEMVPSKTSIMPKGLDQTLSTRELKDLIAFLQSLK